MKNILITGASGGLGSEVVRYFSSGDFRLLCTYSGQAGQDSNHTEWSRWNTNDLLSLGDLTEKIEKYIPLDLWIHLTGGFISGMTLENTPLQKLRNMLDINLESFASLIPVIVPINESNSHLSIVLIGAEAGFNPTEELGAYGVSKAALKFYMDVLVKETRSKSVSINMIVPSIIDTKFNRTAMPDADFSRWVKAVHICDLIRFLQTDSGKQLNGSVLRLGK